MVHGLMYLLQNAYVISQANAHAHKLTRFPGLHLLLSHTYIEYAHTWCFIFVSVFQVVQTPAGL